jgi:hypothetical protein
LIPFAPFFTADKWQGKSMKEELRRKKEESRIKKLEGRRPSYFYGFALFSADLPSEKLKS